MCAFGSKADRTISAHIAQTAHRLGSATVRDSLPESLFKSCSTSKANVPLRGILKPDEGGRSSWIRDDTIHAVKLKSETVSTATPYFPTLHPHKHPATTRTKDTCFSKNWYLPCMAAASRAVASSIAPCLLLASLSATRIGFFERPGSNAETRSAETSLCAAPMFASSVPRDCRPLATTLDINALLRPLPRELLALPPLCAAGDAEGTADKEGDEASDSDAVDAAPALLAPPVLGP